MAAITTSKHNSTEERALHLLGSGIPPETVAAACGVSVSRISQLLSDPEFTSKVAELRFQALDRHNQTDAKYDALEDRLLDSLKDCLPLIQMEPLKLLKAIQVINAAKRRGISSPDQITQQSQVVQLVMPQVLVQKFTTNIHNQVIQAGEQTLQTIPSTVLAQQFAQPEDIKTISASDLIATSSVQQKELPNERSESINRLLSSENIIPV